MKTNFRKIHEKIKNINILVIGDFMIDDYLIGDVERINPEAPVPVLKVKKQRLSLGGAGNVVRNLVSLGANVFTSTVIGDDNDVNSMIKLIEDEALTGDYIIKEQGRETTRKTRLLAQHQHLFRYDNESVHDISSESENKIIHYVKAIIKNIDALILEDYGKGVLTERLLRELINIANNNETICLIDPNRTDWSIYKNANIMTPNDKELSKATGKPVDNPKDIIDVGFEVMAKNNFSYLLVTRGSEGMMLLDGITKSSFSIPAKTKDVYDSAGAGDTVIAALSIALCSGMSYTDAAQFSNEVAGIVVSKSGVATVSLLEVEKYLEKSNYIYIRDSKVKSLDEISEIAEHLRADRNRIVFTNGCFDILHSGHIHYLEGASEYGDVLIIGLNSDSSVKRLKGNDRPINTAKDRADILASLSVVDYVVIFDEDTPYNLINALKPDVLVKGGDYKPEEVIGKDIVESYGGSVIIQPYIEGKSTSNIISKLGSDK